MVKRFLHIDFLRAVAILAVISIHVFSDNITSRLNFYIWNYLHIIIVAFVFCSGYVMYAAYAPKITTWFGILTFYKKRLLRLLLPFYYYLIAHFALMLLFPKFFSGLGLIFSWNFIWQSVTLVGGINLNWLPLLFLQLAVLFPLLVFAFAKKKILFWLYVVVAFLVTIGFTIWQFPYSHYRAVMWIPWSLFLVIPWYFYQKEQKKFTAVPYLSISLISGIFFVGLYFLWMHLGRSLTLIDNKYPPNFFYILYECFGSFFLLAISGWKILKISWVVASYKYVSRASYGLFFIHYIVMDFILSVSKNYALHLSVWTETIFVIAVSILVSLILTKGQKIIKLTPGRENR